MRYSLFTLLFITLSFFQCTSLGQNQKQIQEQKQNEYKVVDFSEKYSARIILNEEVDEESEDQTNATAAFFERGTDREVLRTKVFLDTNYSLNDALEVKSNIVEMPYGEQSTIICGDFNCDGQEDFAVLNGYMSCYGGPSYNVFLQEDGRFELSHEFSRLTQEYCGFFEHNCDAKEISVMTKSGCCWHLFEKYELVDGHPVIKESVVDDELSSIPRGIITKYEKGKEVSVSEHLRLNDIGDNNDNYILKFRLKDKDKKVLLWRDSDELTYYFLGSEDVVELKYSNNFKLTNDQDLYKLSFSNLGAHYELYSNPEKIGINVTVGGKKYNMEGVMPKEYNTLDVLEGIVLENVKEEE